MQVPLQIEDEEFIPYYATKDSAGADLKANILRPIKLHPQESVLIPTGVYPEIPKGFEMQIRPRSGLALKHQVTVLNTPGTIDADYRGEIGVILINHGKNDFIIEPKMRIAQAVLAPVCKAVFVKKEKLEKTTRGKGGFGHTG